MKNKIIKFINKLIIVILWLCILLSIREREINIAIFLMLFIINENIEKKGK